MADSTYIKIGSLTVGSGGASVMGFSSIPAGFTNLILSLSARSTNTSTPVDIRFNGSTDFSIKFGAGYPGLAGPSSGSTTQQIGNIMASNLGTSRFGNLEVFIPNYTSNFKKLLTASSVLQGTSYRVLNLYGGYWNGTAAITSVEFHNASFAEFSSVTLYGVKSGAGGATVTATIP
jgi:hypothetical protein